MRSRWRSASRSSSALVSGTIGASRTSPSIVAPVPSVSSSWASAFAWTIPLTRSWLSSSVTTSRVWPEETQRRSAVSTSSDRSTVTIAGAGVMIWRASCSCRWKTPVSIPASPASSLPPVSDCWISTLSSSGVSPSSSAPAVLTPISRRIAFDAQFSSAMNGWKTRVKMSSGRATKRATRSERWIE